MLRLLLMLLAVVAVPGLAAAHSYDEARYVGSAGEPAVCAPVAMRGLNVGGACALSVHAGRVHVTVADDVLGAVAFSWSARTGLDAPCGAGEGFGEATLSLPPSCTRLTVIPGVGATTGIIRATF
ncbi:MAG TPA: hypothetical protein VFH78_05550 [Candidatus Thermoplasmatota archaeon]|nr:hypothetical protein [Candidatus Thermoplasmatota archaeon]